MYSCSPARLYWAIQKSLSVLKRAASLLNLGLHPVFEMAAHVDPNSVEATDFPHCALPKDTIGALIEFVDIHTIERCASSLYRFVGHLLWPSFPQCIA
jgi:hypothetical protein